MKKEWSGSWISSAQPRKQRKYRRNAPLHVRQGFVRAALSPELRKRYSKRSMRIRKGDEVRVMRGSFKGKTATVETVDLTTSRIFTDDIKVKKVDGSEVPRGLEPSNLMITKLKLDDKKRQAILSRREDAIKAKATKPAEKPSGDGKGAPKGAQASRPARPEPKPEKAKEEARPKASETAAKKPMPKAATQKGAGKKPVRKAAPRKK